MVCKCCVPGCNSNYQSLGKEGGCSVFSFPSIENDQSSITFQENSP